MLHFFYDSLDTLKKVKKPTRKEIRVFTLHVFIVVLVSAFIFFLLDNIRGNLYKQIFQMFGTQNTQVVAPAANIEIPSVAPTNDQPTVEALPEAPTPEGEQPDTPTAEQPDTPTAEQPTPTPEA